MSPEQVHGASTASARLTGAAAVPRPDWQGLGANKARSLFAYCQIGPRPGVAEGAARTHAPPAQVIAPAGVHSRVAVDTQKTRVAWRRTTREAGTAGWPTARATPCVVQ